MSDVRITIESSNLYERDVAHRVLASFIRALPDLVVEAEQPGLITLRLSEADARMLEDFADMRDSQRQN